MGSKAQKSYTEGPLLTLFFKTVEKQPWKQKIVMLDYVAKKRDYQIVPSCLENSVSG